MTDRKNHSIFATGYFGKRSTGGGRSIKKWLDYDRTKDKRI